MSRQLDAEVAEVVMGLKVVERAWDTRTYDERTPRYDFGVVNQDGSCSGGVPSYSTSHDAVAIIRAEIERRGLQFDFVYNLARLAGVNMAQSEWRQMDLWKVLNATPEQQCRAAIAAVKGAR